MPDESFDVRKVIEQSASKTTLQELAKKGIHRVKVLDEQMINKLIHEAVQHIVGSSSNLMSSEEREKLVKASRAELDKLIKEFNAQKDKAELLNQDKNSLAAEVENLQKQLQLQRQLGEQLGKQSLEQGKAFAQAEIEMLKKKLELAQEEVSSLKQRAGQVNVAAIQQREAELNEKLMAEMKKNVELSERLAKTLEDMRSRDDEIAKKMESLFTKSIEGLTKKLNDLRLRSIAGVGGGGGGGGGGAEDGFRQSSDVISHMLGNELESNVKQMEQTEGKTAGTLGNALERLKAMRGGGGEKKEEKKD